MEAAAGLAYIPCTFPGNMDAVQHTFSIAAESGFTVARVFAHGVNSTLALQMSPGVFLDFPSAVHVGDLEITSSKLHKSSDGVADPQAAGAPSVFDKAELHHYLLKILSAREFAIDI